MYSPEHTEEDALVDRAKTEPEAFGHLYERYVDRIYNYIYYRIGDHDEAEDLTARTFYQALDKIGKYEHRGAPFSAWLYRIAHNLVANWRRQRARHRSLSLDDIPHASDHLPGPVATMETKERREALLSAIRRLPADRQQLLFLKFIDRLPNAQIGEMMGRTESSIKSLYHRTLLVLRDDLTERGI